eukprot:3220914-Amphidinium_carterae.1
MVLLLVNSVTLACVELAYLREERFESHMNVLRLLNVVANKVLDLDRLDSQESNTLEASPSIPHHFGMR